MFVQLEELRCMCTILEWIFIKSVGFLIQAQNLSMKKTNLEPADGLGISLQSVILSLNLKTNIFYDYPL